MFRFFFDICSAFFPSDLCSGLQRRVGAVGSSHLGSGSAPTFQLGWVLVIGISSNTYGHRQDRTMVWVQFQQPLGAPPPTAHISLVFPVSRFSIFDKKGPSRERHDTKRLTGSQRKSQRQITLLRAFLCGEVIRFHSVFRYQVANLSKMREDGWWFRKPVAGTN